MKKSSRTETELKKELPIKKKACAKYCLKSTLETLEKGVKSIQS